ncbi:uncharacterized [Tachysurus ichikawai]
MGPTCWREEACVGAVHAVVVTAAVDLLCVCGVGADLEVGVRALGFRLKRVCECSHSVELKHSTPVTRRGLTS